MGENDRGDKREVRTGRSFPAVVTTTLLAAVVAMLAAGVVWDQLADRHRRDQTEYFEFEATEIALRIGERFRGHRQVLRGGRALFFASDEVTREEWREYVEWLELEADHPGIQGVGFAVWLAPEEVAEHVAAVRAEGFPNYQVWPNGEREAYSSIVMLEPFDWRNRRAFGYDMYSEPVRREAMRRAVRTGGSALTGKVTLVQETTQDRQAGVLLYLPVFEHGKPLASEEQRWQALQGWVYSPFRMNDLMTGILGRHSETLRLRVFDGKLAPDALLYDSHPGEIRKDVPSFSATRTLEVDGHEWILTLEALPSFPGGFRGHAAELVAISLVGLLFVGVTWSFSTARERARALARISESLRRSEARYAALLNLAHEGIAATDEDFRLDFVNPQLTEMLGVPTERLRGCYLDSFWSATAPETRQQILSRLRCGLGGRYEVELMHSDGHRLTALVSDAPLADEDGVFRGAILMIADITERKEAERRIQHQATHDPLTGVSNRRRLGDLLAQTLERSRRYGHRFALLFVDLDHFKGINDRHGHLVGDRLLVEAVRRMQQCLRASDMLGRRGGDEFVVILPEIDAGSDARVVAEKIRVALARPFHFDELEVVISSSIGVVLYPEHGEDEQILLRRADEAMYSAKAEGRNRVRSYEE